MPVHLTFLETLPLTGVGKVFKPALRQAAAQRVVSALLADLKPPGVNIDVTVGAHPVHGQLITVTVDGVAADSRDPLELALHAKLNPLTMRHEVVWR